MTHFSFSHRPLFAEARLLRMAPQPGEAPQAEPGPEAKADTAPNKPDPRATFSAAKERMTIHGEHLKALQDKIAPLRTLKVRLEAGDKLTDKDFAPHGIKDDAGDGHADDVQKRMDELDTQLKPHQEAVNKANAEIDDSVKAIEASGPGGKLDAAFMRVDAVMNNPNAGLGEKIAAVLMAFAEMQAVLKGITTPAAAPGSKPGEKGSSPEGDRSSPSGKKETVRQMMKDGGHDELDDLKTDKEQKVTDLIPQKAAAEGAVNGAKTTLEQAQAAQTTAEADLAADKENPAKQDAARTAKANVSEAEAAVKTAQETLASVTKDLAKAEADVKMIKDVEDGVKKDADDFDQSKKILESKLDVLATLPELTPEQSANIKAVKDILAAETAMPASNGIDITLRIARVDMDTFLAPFAKAGLDAKALTIGAGGVIEDPAAFQRGVEQFIAKMTSAGEEKPAEPAAPAAPAAPAGAPPAGPAPAPAPGGAPPAGGAGA